MAMRPDMDEQELLASARGVIDPLPQVEARAGFAARVALNARDRRTSPFGQWLRWSFGGLAVAGAAAAVVAIAVPRPAARSDEIMVAQRLDLFEDMAVMQNQEALEDLEVVAALHELEARP